MPSMLAIVAKKVFEKECPGGKPGATYATSLYASTHKALDPLAQGGSLFLATVRPPDEALWLVAILEKPKKTAAGWEAKNVVPIADVSALRSKIRFSNGSGITDKKGALGMSLQTPRQLTADDEQLLRAVLGGALAPAAAAPAAEPPEKPAPAPKAAEKPAPAPKAPPRDELLRFSEEARRWLVPRTAADLDVTSTDAARKRRAKVAAEVSAKGGIEAVIGGLLEGSLQGEFPELDALLLLEPDDVRKRCEALGEKHWATAGLEQKTRLVSWFPRGDWAAELARDFVDGKIKRDLRDVVLHRLEDPAVLLAFAKKAGTLATLVNVAVTMRERAVPPLAELLDVAEYESEEKAISRALGCIGTPEAAATFAKHLRRKNVRPFATEFFANFPHLAGAALSELAAKKTQVGGVAKDILARVERSQTMAEAPSDAEEASAEELPDVLRNPPWTTPRPKRRLQIVPGLEIPREPLRLHWSERSRLRYVAGHFGRCGLLRPAAETEKLQRAVKEGTKEYLYANHPADVVIPLLESPPPNLHVWHETPGEVLALYGERALGAVVEHVFARGSYLGISAVLGIESPRVAVALAKSKSYRTEAHLRSWCERYPETAAAGLVPFAVGESDHRARAESVLRWMARNGHRDLLLRVADGHGKPARSALEEILGAKDDGPAKAPKMPSSYRPAELRPIRLRNGKVLPRAAMETLDLLLRSSELGEPFEGIDDVRAACDPRSLAEHAWDLAKAWDIDGGKEPQRWMLHAVAHFGDDEVVRRLTPALKGEGIAPMLGEIGTDAALMELVTMTAYVGKTGSRPKYTWGADVAIDLIAARRGLDGDEVVDRFVPTYSVDDRGGIDLELGERKLRLTFDHRLVPVLLDESGNVVKALPRTGVDPEKLAAATTILTDLDEDVAAIASLRTAALERAMTSGRTWRTDDFDAIWVRHPLMIHLTTAILWEARDASGKALGRFRVAEDRSLADAKDDAFELPKTTAAIAVAHPCRMPADERHRWGELFADYRLVQPFDQLAREPAPAGAPTFVARGKLNPHELFPRYERLGFQSSGGVWTLPCEGGVLLTLEWGKDAVTGGAAKDGARLALDALDALDAAARCELHRTLTSLAT